MKLLNYILAGLKKLVAAKKEVEAQIEEGKKTINELKK